MNKDPRIEIIQALTNHNNFNPIELTQLLTLINKIKNLDLDFSLEDTEQEYQDYLSKLFKESDSKKITLTAIEVGYNFQLPKTYAEIEELWHQDYSIFTVQPNMSQATPVMFVGELNDRYEVACEGLRYVCSNKNDYPVLVMPN